MGWTSAGVGTVGSDFVRIIAAWLTGALDWRNRANSGAIPCHSGWLVFSLKLRRSSRSLRLWQ